MFILYKKEREEKGTRMFPLRQSLSLIDEVGLVLQQNGVKRSVKTGCSKKDQTKQGKRENITGMKIMIFLHILKINFQTKSNNINDNDKNNNK